MSAAEHAPDNPPLAMKSIGAPTRQSSSAPNTRSEDRSWAAENADRSALRTAVHSTKIGGVASSPDCLRDVYWLGGGSGSGKTTVAQRLATTYGFHLYSTDEAVRDHGPRTTPEESPLLARFAGMSADERWVVRSPEEMLTTFHWFNGEAFDLIAEDLVKTYGGDPVIVEGFRLLPYLVAPLLAERGHGGIIIPTPEDCRPAALKVESHRHPWPSSIRPAITDGALRIAGARWLVHRAALRGGTSSRATGHRRRRGHD